MNPTDEVLAPLLAEARALTTRKIIATDQLKGLGLLAIAESIHRLAAAVEQLPER